MNVIQLAMFVNPCTHERKSGAYVRPHELPWTWWNWLHCVKVVKGFVWQPRFDGWLRCFLKLWTTYSNADRMDLPMPLCHVCTPTCLSSCRNEVTVSNHCLFAFGWKVDLSRSVQTQWPPSGSNLLLRMLITSVGAEQGIARHVAVCNGSQHSAEHQ